MENIAPHTEADLEFIKSIQDYKLKIAEQKREHSGKNDGGRALNEAVNMIFHDFYHFIKDRKILPLGKTVTENLSIANNFHTLLCNMTQNSMENYKRKMMNQEPKLAQSLNQMIKFNSYNRLLQDQMGMKENFT